MGKPIVSLRRAQASGAGTPAAPGAGSASQRARRREPRRRFGRQTAFCCLSAGKLTRTSWCRAVISRGNKSPALSQRRCQPGPRARLPGYPPPRGVFCAPSDLASPPAMEMAWCLGFFLVSLCFSARSTSAFFIGHQGENRHPPPLHVSHLQTDGGMFLREGGAGVPSTVCKASTTASPVPASSARRRAGIQQRSPRHSAFARG